jgi:hypothetical protein
VTTAKPYGVEIHNYRVEATVPYSIAWIADMKSMTRWNERKWDAPMKTWHFPVGLEKSVVKLCVVHWSHIKVTDLRGTAESHWDPFEMYSEKEQSEYAEKVRREREARESVEAANCRRAERERQQRHADAAAQEERRHRAEHREVDVEDYADAFRSASAGGAFGGFGDFFDAFFRAQQAQRGERVYVDAQRRPPPHRAPPPPVRGGGPATLELAFVELLSGLSNETLAKVYKLAIAAAHPDAGGSHEMAVAVNRAWDAIRRFKKIT